MANTSISYKDSASISYKISSMVNQNQLRLHNRAIGNAIEKLSTGSRINHAKDDPTRNFEMHNVNSDIKNLNKAKQNTTDGAALLQIAEGACGEIQNILQRIRELSVQGSNDTLSSTEREYLNIEVKELLKEVDRISAGSEFNTKQIFGSGEDSLSGEQRKIILSDEDKEAGLQAWTPFSARDSEGNASRAGILHIGYGSKATDEVKVSFPEISAETLGLSNIDFSTQNSSTKALDDIDAAISSLGSIRSYMGSLVSRMDNQEDMLNEMNINMNDHSSKISDTDFAQEVTDLTLAQIRQQAAISVLAQSNAKVGNILQILG